MMEPAVSNGQEAFNSKGKDPWPRVCLVCDPCFSGRRNMTMGNSYYIFDLGRLRPGRYSFATSCDVRERRLRCSYRRLGEPQEGSRDLEFELYVDPGNNCLFVWECHIGRAGGKGEASQSATDQPDGGTSQAETLTVPARRPISRSRAKSARPADIRRDVSIVRSGESESDAADDGVIDEVVEWAISRLRNRFATNQVAAGEPSTSKPSSVVPGLRRARIVDISGPRKKRRFGVEEAEETEDGSDGISDETTVSVSPDRDMPPTKFSCPFYKFNPVMNKHAGACSDSSWDSLLEVKYVRFHPNHSQSCLPETR